MTGNTYKKSIEVWKTQSGLVQRIAVRDQHGRFHGATNFGERQPLKVKAS